MDTVISQWHVQPSEFDKMQFWRIQEMFDNFKESVEKQSSNAETSGQGNKETSSMIAKAKSRIFGEGFKMPNPFKSIKI